MLDTALISGFLVSGWVLEIWDYIKVWDAALILDFFASGWVRTGCIPLGRIQGPS